jgi:hypothetical protein
MTSFDPLDLEILERALDAAQVAIRSGCAGADVRRTCKPRDANLESLRRLGSEHKKLAWRR